MTGNNCCVLRCKSARFKHVKGKRVKNEGLRFFSIPTVITRGCSAMEELTKRRRMKWIERIRRKDIVMTSTAQFNVCSRHFKKDKPAGAMYETDIDWAPHLHLGHAETKVLDNGRGERQRDRATKRRLASQGPDVTKRRPNVRRAPPPSATAVGPQLPSQSPVNSAAHPHMSSAMHYQQESDEKKVRGAVEFKVEVDNDWNSDDDEEEKEENFNVAEEEERVQDFKIETDVACDPLWQHQQSIGLDSHELIQGESFSESNPYLRVAVKTEPEDNLPIPPGVHVKEEHDTDETVCRSENVKDELLSEVHQGVDIKMESESDPEFKEDETLTVHFSQIKEGAGNDKSNYKPGSSGDLQASAALPVFPQRECETDRTDNGPTEHTTPLGDTLSPCVSNREKLKEQGLENDNRKRQAAMMRLHMEKPISIINIDRKKQARDRMKKYREKFKE